MQFYIGFYLAGLGLTLGFGNTMLLVQTVKLNEVPDWKQIAEQWALSVAWPFWAILLLEIWAFEAIRFALNGRYPDQ